MTTVAELIPGDLVTDDLGSFSATFVARTQHPIWPHLQLVVWRLEDTAWSHDALSSRQHVGVVSVSTDAERQARLRTALLGGAR